MTQESNNPLDKVFEIEEEIVDELPVSSKKKRSILFVLDVVVNILIIVVLVYTVRTYFVSPFQVFGPSMCSTLNDIDDICQHGFGEYLIVNKSIYQNFFGLRYRTPRRGDIVVFHPPHDDKEFYIKRIIGEPGDQIEIKNGIVYIYNESNPSGVALNEYYLNDVNRDKTFLSGSTGKVTVPEGYYYVLGDNRRESTDSRSCFLPSLDSGCDKDIDHLVAFDRIEGKATLILWPFEKIRILHNPTGVMAASN
ncbi:MAG: signal peptidase I [Patescibacteria group bacterium]